SFHMERESIVYKYDNNNYSKECISYRNDELRQKVSIVTTGGNMTQITVSEIVNSVELVTTYNYVYDNKANIPLSENVFFRPFDVIPTARLYSFLPEYFGSKNKNNAKEVLITYSENISIDWRDYYRMKYENVIHSQYQLLEKVKLEGSRINQNGESVVDEAEVTFLYEQRY
ncbi:MAG: hypothetical protein LIO93_03540, partial [Bacteroidales bacterium]|nr:hypothetical protein [Bacteroidales bacterium]